MKKSKKKIKILKKKIKKLLKMLIMLLVVEKKGNKMNAFFPKTQSYTKKNMHRLSKRALKVFSIKKKKIKKKFFLTIYFAYFFFCSTV